MAVTVRVGRRTRSWLTPMLCITEWVVDVAVFGMDFAMYGVSVRRSKCF